MSLEQAHLDAFSRFRQCLFNDFSDRWASMSETIRAPLDPRQVVLLRCEVLPAYRGYMDDISRYMLSRSSAWVSMGREGPQGQIVSALYELDMSRVDAMPGSAIVLMLTPATADEGRLEVGFDLTLLANREEATRQKLTGIYAKCRWRETAHARRPSGLTARLARWLGRPGA